MRRFQCRLEFKKGKRLLCTDEKNGVRIILFLREKGKGTVDWACGERGCHQEPVARHEPAMAISPFDVHVRFSGRGWAIAAASAIRGLMWSRPWRLKGVLLAATSNGPIQRAVRGVLLLTQAAPDHRHCGMASPALFSKGVETRKKRLKLDEASVAGGSPRWRVTCRRRPLHASRPVIGPAARNDQACVDRRSSTCPSRKRPTSGFWAHRPPPLLLPLPFPFLFLFLILPPASFLSSSPLSRGGLFL